MLPVHYLAAALAVTTFCSAAPAVTRNEAGAQSSSQRLQDLSVKARCKAKLKSVCGVFKHGSSRSQEPKEPPLRIPADRSPPAAPLTDVTVLPDLMDSPTEPDSATDALDINTLCEVLYQETNILDLCDLNYLGQVSQRFHTSALAVLRKHGASLPGRDRLLKQQQEWEDEPMNARFLSYLKALGGTQTAPQAAESASSTLQSLRKIITQLQSGDSSSRCVILRLIRSKIIQKDVTAADIIQTYERKLMPSTTTQVSYHLPQPGPTVWDAIRNGGRKRVGPIAAFKLNLEAGRMRDEIERWWKNESRVAPIWFVWVTMFKPEDRFDLRGASPGLVSLPPDLFTVMTTFDAAEGDLFIRMVLQDQLMWAFMNVHLQRPNRGHDVWRVLRQDNGVPSMLLGQDPGLRLRAYYSLNEEQRTRLIREVQLRIQDGRPLDRITPRQAFELSKMIVIAGGPDRRLEKLPNREDRFLGLKAICQKKWEKLNSEAKVIIWESALAMTKRWDQFKVNMLDHDSQGLFDGVS